MVAVLLTVGLPLEVGAVEQVSTTVATVDTVLGNAPGTQFMAVRLVLFCAAEVQVPVRVSTDGEVY